MRQNGIRVGHWFVVGGNLASSHLALGFFLLPVAVHKKDFDLWLR